MDGSGVAMKKANFEMVAELRKGLEAQEVQLFKLLEKSTDHKIAVMCFTRLDRIMSLKASLGLIVVGWELGLGSAVALGTSIYTYFSNTNPDRDGELWAKVDSALGEVIAQTSKISEIEIDTARMHRDTMSADLNAAKENQRKAAADAAASERNTHNWLWKVFH
ncbi:MAG: hypothetical protein LBI34_01100 [Puniceicoccales bacterium]|nr:hypothetical protein [Puniceicoccales bacterium]